MLNKNTTQGTFLVATVLCLVCSILVSGAAVGLKPLQERNKALDRKKNILAAAGMMQEGGGDIEEIFKQVETRGGNLKSGDYLEDIDAKTYDQRKASRDSEQNFVIPRRQDFGNIKTRAKYATVYLVKEQGNLKQLVIPVSGKGLWGTMYGFLALAPDTTTSTGFSFYEHVETPGLGGEVDNPKWKAQWPGKKVYDDAWKPAITVVKGAVNLESPQAIHQIDGLSGATITSRGVQNLLKFWLGDLGFGPYLAKIRQGGSR